MACVSPPCVLSLDEFCQQGEEFDAFHSDRPKGRILCQGGVSCSGGAFARCVEPLPLLEGLAWFVGFDRLRLVI